MYKNPPLGFLMLFCHVFIDAPEKLPKFGAFSTLGTALLVTEIFNSHLYHGGVLHSGDVPQVPLVVGNIPENPPHDLSRPGLGQVGGGLQSRGGQKALFLKIKYL